MLDCFSPVSCIYVFTFADSHNTTRLASALLWNFRRLSFSPLVKAPLQGFADISFDVMVDNHMCILAQACHAIGTA